MKKYISQELKSFREGIKCGFDLFSYRDEETGLMIHSLSGSKSKLTKEQFHSQVDEGRWDDEWGLRFNKVGK